MTYNPQTIEDCAKIADGVALAVESELAYTNGQEGMTIAQFSEATGSLETARNIAAQIRALAKIEQVSA